MSATSTAPVVDVILMLPPLSAPVESTVPLTVRLPFDVRLIAPPLLASAATLIVLPVESKASAPFTEILLVDDIEPVAVTFSEVTEVEIVPSVRAVEP